jgi:hypothetical protein
MPIFCARARARVCWCVCVCVRVRVLVCVCVCVCAPHNHSPSPRPGPAGSCRTSRAGDAAGRHARRSEACAGGTHAARRCCGAADVCGVRDGSCAGCGAARTCEPSRHEHDSRVGRFKSLMDTRFQSLNDTRFQSLMDTCFGPWTGTCAHAEASTRSRAASSAVLPRADSGKQCARIYRRRAVSGWIEECVEAVCTVHTVHAVCVARSLCRHAPQPHCGEHEW